MSKTTRTLLLPLLCTLVMLGEAAAQDRDRRPDARDEGSAAAIVNGARVPLRVYQDQIHDQLSHQRKEGRNAAIEQDVADQIFLQVIEAELLRQEAASRGVTVTRNDAVRALLENPPDFIVANFTDSRGVFQKETFRAVVLRPELISQALPTGRDKDEMEREWRSDLEKVIRYVQTLELRRRLGERLLRDRPLTEAMIRARYFAEKTIFDGSFIRILYSTLPDSSVTVSDAEAKQWYDAHIDDYKFPAQRQVGALIIPLYPSSSDSVRNRTAISNARTEITQAPLADRPVVVSRLARSLPPDRFPPKSPIALDKLPAEMALSVGSSQIGDLVGPFGLGEENVLVYIEGRGATLDTVVHARHMLVKVEGAEENADSIAREFLVSIKEKITNEKEFIEAAQTFGQDGARSTGGDLGYFGRGKMVESFERVCFSAPVGKVHGPVRTEFGYHLIWVIDKIALGYRLRELRFPLTVTDSAREVVMRDAIAYAQKLNERAPDTDSLYRALRARYPYAVADTSVLKRLELYGDILGPANFAFSNPPGSVSVLPLPANRIMIAQCIQGWPSGVAPYDKIKWNFVIPHVRRSRQLDLLATRARALRDTMTATMTLGNIRLSAPLAEAYMIEGQALTSPEDEETTLLDSLIERAQDGGVSGPVRGIYAWYLLRIEQRKKAPTSADYRRDRKDFSADYRERYRDRLVSEVLDRARKYATLQDLRPQESAGE